ncbi:molybdenum cofactor biosynthesis protein MoaD [Sulfolobus sp. A20]|uniref:MoaD family protein n=2 Tax=Sulfolobaceae TaxID=118883 RepID=UPI000845FFE5|nr:MoaD family protein [Sulfolobus sp. A20]TRM75397.1 MoaD family protein [Sulfolobus sp. E5]TRM78433.1 MoaD family protein [Sulfolobus sp. A20-N-F8]TRM82594.1 MoaD family protein [Sulfolobus sp. A20-N-F6]TRM84838.1 MoaD family protein [Sulfolobus sp. F3]TRM86336.1 MoaD family protein [Sulfolobus sp. E3]TRM89188.1 MoaD family protein [Sulfolobus sp. C3]TRN02088.1 MoaD family protein [Sulfolobus sp. E1]TRN03586.1 MoaD family protein [Sulfolobus sp. F1]
MKKVKIMYFAFLKDITGKSMEEMETECSEINCIIDELSNKYGDKFRKYVKEGINGIRVTVLINGSTRNSEIKEGDEIAFLPPPSGGDLRNDKIDILEEIKKFRSKAPPEAGSLVVYVGFVKGIVEGHKVYELVYEAYEEYTKKRFSEIKEEMKKKYKDLIDLEIHHVINAMKPGEDVLLIMGLGRGRKDAIDAVKETLELVKHTTGIWKLEIRDDGEYWVVAGNTRVKKE